MATAWGAKIVAFPGWGGEWEEQMQEDKEALGIAQGFQEEVMKLSSER